MVLLRLLKFVEGGGLSINRQIQLKMKCIRVLLWSNLSVFSVTSVICAAILFFDSLRGGSRNLFAAMTTVIVLMRCFCYLLLAILFMFSGLMRYRLILPLHRRLPLTL
jgi:hypothetical protein